MIKFFTVSYKMIEGVYPKLLDDKMNFMMDKQKALREKLAHYKKIKKKWSCVNTALKITGISLSCILCGASILTMTPFSIPIAAAILGGISLGNTAMTNLLTERFTSKRKKYFRQKCDHIKDYLNKMGTLFIKCKEDGQISPEEFEQFQKLLKEYESAMINTKSEIKSKDVKKVEKMAKKELRQQRLNQLFEKTLQELQH